MISVLAIAAGCAVGCMEGLLSVHVFVVGSSLHISGVQVVLEATLPYFADCTSCSLSWQLPLVAVYIL